MSTKPGDGERRAASGYRAQYLIGAGEILQKLQQGDLEWIRVADPDAGRVDDLQVRTSARVDAYQVKWAQYGGTTTLNDLTKGTDQEPSLIAQLSDGWKRLRQLYPECRVVVHLVTNTNPSPNLGASMPKVSKKPSPYHLSAFIKQAWIPAQKKGYIESDVWEAVWHSFRQASNLSDDEFLLFMQDCSLDFQSAIPSLDSDIKSIVDFLFETAAGAERIVEISRDAFLTRLGWLNRYQYRNTHDFPAPFFLYRPIQNTASKIEAKLDELSGGYLGVFGSPGSGKSTLLTQTLRTLPVRLFRYYAYVPDIQDLSVLRGESVNFLQDITLKLSEAGFSRIDRPDPSDRLALLRLLQDQLRQLGDSYQETGTKTVILIDGLDHIAREQNPERSLLNDLPFPEAIPAGVYIILGSQPIGINDLPPRTYQALKSSERHIEMGRLSSEDVYHITNYTIPSIVGDEQRQIFELSGGHPLALTYLLKQLLHAQGVDERSQLLQEVIPYKGDIDVQYWSHWQRVEQDEKLIDTLGLIARIRGIIPLEWIAEWASRETLKKLETLLLTFFFEEGENSWSFFHNSFRLFLEERTAEPLIGQGKDQQHQYYHHILAKHYETSVTPYRWETLYHLYKAGEYRSVTEIANQSWFREQAENLRPYKAIWTDIRIAFKAAGECQDVISLMELTLAGAAIDQRINELEGIEDIPDLLMQVGRFNEAIEYLRDGNSLRVNAEQALRFSIQLYDIGLVSEAQRLFELSEPLEYLSGQLISNDNYRLRNLETLLCNWTRSALIFRNCEEVIEIIQRIKIEPNRVNGEDIDHTKFSRELQDWLMLQGLLFCSERSNQTNWQVLFNALIKKSNRRVHFFALLRSVELAHKKGEKEHANALLKQLLDLFNPDDVKSFVDTEQLTDVYLDIAHLALDVMDNKAIAKSWSEKLSPIALKSKTVEYEKSTICEQQFQYGCLCFLLGQEHEPQALRNQAEAHTDFDSYVEEAEKQGYRIFTLAVFHLARLWAWGYSDFYLQPSVFLKEIRWILDLVGPRYTEWAKPFYLEAQWNRSWILRCIIGVASLHGQTVLKELVQELETRWVNQQEEASWSIDIQREAITELINVGASSDWAKAQLKRIEPVMLRNLEPRERAEACKAQAEAWLLLNEKDLAATELERMVQTARGIAHRKDYQLPVWVEWLGKINQLEPDQAEERSLLMLKRILSVQESSSGVADAAKQFIGVIFQTSPRHSVSLLKGFLELDLIGYQSSLTSLLERALETEEPPILEVIHTTVELLLPFIKNENSDIAKTLLIKTANQFGSEAALDLAHYLIERVEVDMLDSCRLAWRQTIAAEIEALGYTQEEAGLKMPTLINISNPDNTNGLDRRLHLKSGEHLGKIEVLNRACSIADLKALIEMEDTGTKSFFRWHEVIESLSQKFSTTSDLKELENIVKTSFSIESYKGDQFSRMLLSLSKRFLETNNTSLAWKLAEQALSMTEDSLDCYFNEGARYEILKHLILIDENKGREKAIKLYSEDGSKGNIPTYRTVLNIDTVVELLLGQVPTSDIWRIIEEYLNELFAGVLVESELPEELISVGEIPVLRNDSPAQAIADFLVLHLDHPSYPVAQGAVRACTLCLLKASTTVIHALKEALESTEQSAERALMVLDAASSKEPKSIKPFEKILNNLKSSYNFLIRFLSSCVWAAYRDEDFLLKVVGREILSTYSLELPSISRYRTEQLATQEGYAVVLLQDPALKLRPLDIEAREIARLAEIPEYNVLYQAIKYFHQLEKQRIWLAGVSKLNEKVVSRFLDGIGLVHTFQKPHISTVRQALSHICADLYDGGYFSQQALQQLPDILLYHDPNFILHRPLKRPSCIASIGDLSISGSSFVQIPENWVGLAENSLPLLNSRLFQDRIILGEWTKLKYLDNKSPQEERISMVRAAMPEQLWIGTGIESGHRPFTEFIKCQSDEYLFLNKPLDHLIISVDGYGFDTPGSFWIAFNPAVAQALGWHLLDGNWFRWANQSGDLVVESLWWNDGPINQCSEHINCEVGCGWLVLVTEQGFEEIRQWARVISRGSLITRSLGNYGSDGKGTAHSVLSLL